MKSEWRVTCNDIGGERFYGVYTGCGTAQMLTIAATVSALMTGYYARSSV